MQGPTLGDRVDVGAGAMILGKVKVGDDARIGANAVVMMKRAGRRDGRGPAGTDHDAAGERRQQGIKSSPA